MPLGAQPISNMIHSQESPVFFCVLLLPVSRVVAGQITDLTTVSSTLSGNPILHPPSQAFDLIKRHRIGNPFYIEETTTALCIDVC